MKHEQTLKIYSNPELPRQYECDQEAQSDESVSKAGPAETELAASFMRTILYFDVFNYPLTQDEIFSFCDRKINDMESAKISLQWLCNQKILNHESGFYFTGSNSKIIYRLKGNTLARKRMKTARFYSSIISRFPFVRGVYISGSLSKNFMASNSDIDFFIIAEPGRLWLSRTLLVLFKRLILFGSHRNFCINFMLAANNLSINERNIYSATETLMLIPMFNHQLFNEFLEVNDWWKEYYPNYQVPQGIEKLTKHPVKRFTEWLLRNRFGDMLDDLSYSLSMRYWEKKYMNDEPSMLRNRLKSDRNTAAYFPQRQQLKILRSFRQKLIELEKNTGLSLFANSDKPVTRITA